MQYFSFSDLLHLAQYCPDLSMLLQMARFHFIVKQCSLEYIYLVFFIYSSMNGHFSCFNILIIVHNTSINVKVHLSFKVLLYLDKYTEMEQLDHITILLSSFWETFIWFSILVVPIYIPINSGYPKIPFSLCFPQYLLSVFLIIKSSDECKVIPHCGFSHVIPW